MSTEGPSVSYLFVVDDSLFFIKADQHKILGLSNIFDLYGNAFGHLNNFDKSKITDKKFFTINENQLKGSSKSTMSGWGIYLGLSEQLR